MTQGKFILCLIVGVFISLGVSAQNTDNRLIDAVTLLENGDYAKTQTILNTLLKAEPDNDALYYYLGLSEIGLKDFEKAEEHLKKAVELDGKNYWYRLRLASLYEQKGETDLVVGMYEEILKEFPDKNDVHFELLNLYLRQKQYEKALSSLDAIENQMGVNEQTVSTRYEILRTLDRTEEALKVLQDYNDRYASAPVLSMIGDYYLSEFKDTLALASYREAQEIQSDYVPALLGESEVYRTTRRYPQYFGVLKRFFGDAQISPQPKAVYLGNVTRTLDPKFVRRNLAEYDSLIALGRQAHPKDSVFLSAAGMYYFATDRKDSAKVCLARYMELYPESFTAVATYVEALAYMEDWETLRTISGNAAEKYPLEGAFLEYNSMAAYNLKDFEAVIRNEEKVLERFPGDTAKVLRALSSIGDMYHELGDEKASYKAYDKALKINKNYAPVLNNYAWYLCKSGKQLKKALQMSKRTIDAEPDNPTYLDTYGWILHLLGKDQEAKAYFKHAMLYGGKESTVMLCHYAEVLYKLKEYDLAKVYWMQAIKQNNGEVLRLEENVQKKLEAVGKW